MNMKTAGKPQPATQRFDGADEITRGVCRLLRDLGYSPLTEFRVGNRRRVDVVGISRTGRFAIVEVKSSVQDFKSDAKWHEYPAHGDLFYFAVGSDFPSEILPQDCGIIVGDAYGARCGGRHRNSWSIRPAARRRPCGLPRPPPTGCSV